MSEALIDALDARQGILCAIGAGGKKTTLYALARAHPGRFGLTCTVFMTSFSRTLGVERLVTDARDLPAAVTAAAGGGSLAWARPAEKPGRVGGIPAEEVAACHAAAGFDVTLVKADGARMRALKAPRADEPVVPAEADTVVWLVSAAAFGQPLDETIAHRPERAAEVAGVEPGAVITPEVVGTLMTSTLGALHKVPSRARVIPVINAVDDAEREQAARTTAAIALDASDRFDRVVLTRHRDGADVVARINRDSG